MRNSGRARGFLGLLSVVRVVIVGLLCFGLWFAVASDYSDRVVTGTVADEKMISGDLCQSRTSF
jgi:hypothetical protein